MNLLIPVFANYYTNYASITEEERERFATIVYIVAAVAAAVFVLHLLYGFFTKMAHIKRNFIEYYQKENIKRPRFHFWYYWTKPCFNPDNRTLWSFAGEIWQKDYIFNTIGEYFKVKRNIYDIIALPLRGILLILVWVVMILSVLSEFSDGDSGDSFSGSFKGGHGSGRSGGGRSGGGMGRGGGGRSGGGFGGRR